MGRDAGVIRDALARHAPDVPVIVVERNETSVMGEAIECSCRARPTWWTSFSSPRVRLVGHVHRLHRTWTCLR